MRSGATGARGLGATLTHEPTCSGKAEAKSDTTSGQAPLEVAFSSEGSSDADGDELSYSWDFGDGATSDEAVSRHVEPESAVRSNRAHYPCNSVNTLRGVEFAVASTLVPAWVRI